MACRLITCADRILRHWPACSFREDWHGDRVDDDGGLSQTNKSDNGIHHLVITFSQRRKYMKTPSKGKCTQKKDAKMFLGKDAQHSVCRSTEVVKDG